MSLSVRQKKGIDFWRYDFTLDKKRYRGWIGPTCRLTRKEANNEIIKIKADILSDKFDSNRKPANVTPAEVFEQYNEYLKLHKPATYRTYQFAQRAFTSFFGRKAIITHTDIIKYQRERLANGVSGTTVNRDLHYCNAAYNRAIKKGLTDKNPFRNFDKFPETHRTRYLTEAELKKLLIHLTGMTREIVLTAILTGLRRGNVFRLHRSQVDFDAGVINVPATQSKNKLPLSVPLPATLIDIFRRRIATSKSGYVFENPNTGKPITSIKKSFKTALSAAGIEDFHFHDLRHTYASYALRSCRDLRTVQELLGHQSLRMTEKYTHVAASQKHDVSLMVSDMIKKAMESDSEDKRE